MLLDRFQCVTCIVLFICTAHYFQGANDLRQRIIRFFAYHDMDESGECSVAELRSALAPLMEGVPFHVMAALLDRYDANGDGSVGSCLAPRRDRSIHSIILEQPNRRTSADCLHLP